MLPRDVSPSATETLEAAGAEAEASVEGASLDGASLAGAAVAGTAVTGAVVAPPPLHAARRRLTPRTAPAVVMMRIAVDSCPFGSWTGISTTARRRRFQGRQRSLAGISPASA